MNKQQFIIEIISRYLKGFTSIVFVSDNYIIYPIYIFGSMSIQSIGKIYDTFKYEIKKEHYRFI